MLFTTGYAGLKTPLLAPLDLILSKQIIPACRIHKSTKPVILQPRTPSNTTHIITLLLVPQSERLNPTTATTAPNSFSTFGIQNVAVSVPIR